MVVCPVCAAVVERKSKAQYTCGRDQCRWVVQSRRRSRDPRWIERWRERFRRQRHGRARPELFAAPAYGEWLPGGGCEIRIDGPLERPIDLEHAYLLHAAVTAAVGGHATQATSGSSRLPAWSLVPWECSSGWGIWFGSEDLLRLVGTWHDVRIGRSEVALGFGHRARIRAPRIEHRGWHRVRIEAITPVVIQSDDRATHYTTPHVSNLVSTLGKILRPRLGLAPGVEDIVIEILERHTEPRRYWGGPTIGDHGGVQGWVGSVELRANAVAAWLLLAAARGPGLGGRTAYGCGRIHAMATKGTGRS